MSTSVTDTPRAAAMVRSAAVVLGAGSGSRMGAGRNKVLLPLLGVPVLARSVRTALRVPGVEQVVLVVRAGEEAEVRAAVEPHLAESDRVVLVPGGDSRHASEQAGLAVLRGAVAAGEIDVIAIHDGARPLAGIALWQQTIALAAACGGAIPVRSVSGIVRRADATAVSGVGVVQTPQAFRARDLLEAYRLAAEEGFEGTDTAACLERYRPGLRIGAVPGTSENIKVTFPEDLSVAEALNAQP